MSKIRAIYVFSVVSRIACGLIATELAVTTRKNGVVDIAGLVVVGSLSLVTISAISHMEWVLPGIPWGPLKNAENLSSGSANGTAPCFRGKSVCRDQNMPQTCSSVQYL
jgi:hypothetical protein